MDAWNSGYITDIEYTYGYYAELNPLRIELAFLNAGYQFPKVKNACELGFGQGLSVNIHAAGNSTTSWYGTDFNASQAVFSQGMANASGAKAQLSDQSFSEFCERDDLPEFEFIALHGIWTWISDENRQVIVDFIRRKLAVGGVLYISYNTLPGWAAAAPLRHLLSQHASIMTGSGQGVIKQVEEAVGFTQRLIETQPLYTTANALIPERFNKLKEQNKNYLAHEYFNRHWEPMYFSDMAEWLEAAKVSFACSTHYLDHIDAINLTTEQSQLLGTIADATFKQTIRDYMVNQQFRKDYWLKGPRKLDALSQAEALRNHRVILITHRPDVPEKVQGSRGSATLNAEVYGPILEVLGDYHVHSISALETQLKPKGIALGQIVNALVILAGMGHVYSVQEDKVIKDSQKTSKNLNLEIMAKARIDGEIAYLSSPVTGGGIPTPRFHQLFALAIHQGKKQPQEWANFVWQTLAAQGRLIVKEGRTLQTAEENIAELTAQAQEFEIKRLPQMKALMLI